jgi:hypothetical protein
VWASFDWLVQSSENGATHLLKIKTTNILISKLKAWKLTANWRQLVSSCSCCCCEVKTVLDIAHIKSDHIRGSSWLSWQRVDLWSWRSMVQIHVWERRGCGKLLPVLSVISVHEAGRLFTQERMKTWVSNLSGPWVYLCARSQQVETMVLFFLKH